MKKSYIGLVVTIPQIDLHVEPLFIERDFFKLIKITIYKLLIYKIFKLFNKVIEFSFSTH